MISRFIKANERVFWGGFFIIFGFAGFLFTAVITKLLPPLDNAIIFAIQNDRTTNAREMTSFRDGFQPSWNGYYCHHGVMHLIREIESGKVLKGMCVMDNQIFKKHLRSFYLLITKLVCREQMDIRGALAELFSMQLNGLVQ